MTNLQYERITALAKIELTNSFQKGFIRTMAAHAKFRRNMNLSENQAKTLAQITWDHQRSLPGEIVPAQDPRTVGVSPTETETSPRRHGEHGGEA